MSSDLPQKDFYDLFYDISCLDEKPNQEESKENNGRENDRTSQEREGEIGG